FAAATLLKTRDNPFAASLREGFHVQAAALVILFVPVTFSDVWVCLAWAVLSIAFGVVGARMDRGQARGASLITWILALFRLAYDLAGAVPSSSVRGTWLVIFGSNIEAATILAWLLATVGHVVAWLGQVEQPGTDAKIRERRQQFALSASLI